MIHIYLLFLLVFPQSISTRSNILTDSADEECLIESEVWTEELKGTGPLMQCETLSYEWFECEDVSTLVADNSTKNSACPFFGERNGVVAKVNVTCRVLPCIECFGNRQFQREVPCLKYNGYYFLTALIYSIFLGFVAIDRFYLGYSAIGIGKLLTLGGFGVWWIADIILLLYGGLKPADDFEWETWNPY